jgi:hypothetical protein
MLLRCRHASVVDSCASLLRLPDSSQRSPFSLGFGENGSGVATNRHLLISVIAFVTQCVGGTHSPRSYFQNDWGAIPSPSGKRGISRRGTLVQGLGNTRVERRLIEIGFPEYRIGEAPVFAPGRSPYSRIPMEVLDLCIKNRDPLRLDRCTKCSQSFTLF